MRRRDTEPLWWGMTTYSRSYFRIKKERGRKGEEGRKGESPSAKSRPMKGTSDEDTVREGRIRSKHYSKEQQAVLKSFRGNRYYTVTLRCGEGVLRLRG